MASRETIPQEQYITDHDPRAAGKSVTWICMDDRYAKVDGLYRQIAGGNQGVGIDTAVATGMLQLRCRQAAGSHRLNTETRAPAHVFSAFTAQILARSGIHLLNHEGCAAEAYAATISKAVVEQQDTVFELAKNFKPDITWPDYELAAAAHEQSVISDTPEVLSAVNDGVSWNGTKLRPVPRVPLVDIPHIAGELLADHNSKVAFNAREALEAGVPAYHVSSGDLPEIHYELDAHFPTRREDFLTANAVRTAATSLFLPRPEGVDDLKIHVVGL